MIVKRNMLMDVFHVLENLKDKKMPIRVTYSIVKNRRIIQSEIDSIQETIKPTERFNEFEKSRVNLCEKYCEKNENGKPVVTNNSYTFSESNLNLFNSEFSQLKYEYKDEIDKRNNIEQDLNRLLSEEINIDFQTIKLNELPEDLLSLKEFEILFNSGIIIED